MYYMSLSTHKVVVQVVLFAFVFSLLIRVMFLEFSLLVLFVCTLYVYVLFVFMLLHYFCLVDCKMFLGICPLDGFWYVAGTWVCCWHVVIPFAFDK